MTVSRDDVNPLGVQGGTNKGAGRFPWFKGAHRNFMPTREELAAPNVIDEYFLRGWLPDKPFITEGTNITAFGSCFALEINKRLALRGFNTFKLKYKRIPIVFAPADINNTFVIRQQFEWAFQDRKFSSVDGLWWTKEQSLVEPLEEARIQTRQAVIETGVFILTLGLSEIWYNKKTGGVFWRGVPDGQFDADSHDFRVSTVSENIDNLESIWEMIKANNPEAKVVFTLSPVPLRATHRPVSCVTANTASKAILRAAVDEFIRAHPDSLNKDLS
jgi:hypothetical protein